MSAKVELHSEKHKGSSVKAYFTKVLPFVENKRGVLIHRPRYANIYNLHKQAHMAVLYLCGNGTTGAVTENSNIKFLALPPTDCIMCERCEAIAQSLDLPSASAMAGHHIHHGKVMGVITCCKESK